MLDTKRLIELDDELLFDTLFLYCDLPGKKILGYNFLKFKMVTS